VSADYPPNMTLRPLQRWPREETRNRTRSPFRSTWSATIKLLDRELYYLWGGRYYPASVVQIALREQDFRQDGLPRASAIPSMPGVILHIESDKGPLSFPCDKFDRWQDNLRAIALGLEALRKVDRYGITPGNEQYTGWKALPASPSHFVSAEEAAEYLRAQSGPMRNNGTDLQTIQQAYRLARARTHPDRSGDRSLWDRVEAAADVLRAAGAL
jgi:hypothetical protein